MAHHETEEAKRLIRALIIGGAVVFYILNKDSDKPEIETSAKSAKQNSLIDQVKSQDDLKKFTDEQNIAFCKELLQYDAEAPEVAALHARLGMDGSLTENLWLGCSVGLAGDSYVQNDMSGGNDVQYRKNAEQYRKIAKTFTFSLYDTTYAAEGIDVTTRTSSDIKGEAKNLYIRYATLIDGGFNPYRSDTAISINIFDRRDFPALTSNCGPSLMKVYATYSDNEEPCIKITETYAGQPIYASDGTGAKTHTVTIGNTRIVVKARSAQEAISVIKGMKQTTADKMDFLLKN